MVVRRALIVPGLVAVCGALWLAGCSDNVAEGTVITVPDADPKPPESVSRLQAPSGRTGQVLNRIRAFRGESFNVVDPTTGNWAEPYPIAADNVLYTAANRHAIYLNTLNSAGNGQAGTINPGDRGTITTSSSYDSLHSEPVVGGSPYPSQYTNTKLEDRVLAVVGGQNLLSALGAGNLQLAELFVFDGDVSTSTGSASEFRGYARTSADAAEDIWYSRRGRQYLMRSNLRYVGYGQKDDQTESGRSISPPYPILGDQFLGTWVVASSRPAVGVLGFWPNNANQDVNPFGLDTDMNGPLQYSGPPIHLTLPTAQPFMRENGVEINLTRYDAYNGSPVTPTFPYSQSAYRKLRVFSNVSGLTVVNSGATSIGGYAVQGTPAPVIYQAPMSGATNQGAIITDRITTHYRYRIAFGGGTDLGTAALPLVSAGDTLTIAVSATASPFPTSASVGEYQYSVEAVNYSARTVDVLIPVFDSSNFPFEASPTTPSTLKIRYGTVDNVTLSVTSTSSTGSVAVEVDGTMQLGNGELMIIPTAPLEANAWYLLTLKAKTFSAVYPDPTVAPYYTVYTVYFKTNAKSF